MFLEVHLGIRLSRNSKTEGLGGWILLEVRLSLVGVGRRHTIVDGKVLATPIPERSSPLAQGCWR